MNRRWISPAEVGAKAQVGGFADVAGGGTVDGAEIMRGYLLRWAKLCWGRMSAWARDTVDEQKGNWSRALVGEFCLATPTQDK